jgi:hypothetical protein
MTAKFLFCMGEFSFGIRVDVLRSNFSITGGSRFCSPVLWAIVGLQHYAGIFIALGTGLLIVVPKGKQKMFIV